MKRTAAIAVLLVSCAAPVRAQGLRVQPSPAAGEMIRVTPESGAPLTGRLASLGGDTLLLMPASGDSAVMAVVSRQRVEVRRSRRELWSGLGALAGLSAGAVAGQFQSGENGGLKKTKTSVVAGAGAAVVGGILGFVVAPRRWQPLHAVDRATGRPVPPPPTLEPAAPVATDSASAPPPRATPRR
ncbi:MAG TPA: hypothetical protein VFJ16_20665 [Longimicrobium sp.]|nr:hypothetical protein [Longimicrobium sp.]